MAVVNPAATLGAFGIADDCVRSEIELYARQQYAEGMLFFDTSRAVSDGADGLRDLAVVQRALDYIAARGDVWPWRLKRHINNPALVRFEDKGAEVPHGNY
ncbi:hypothetical protein [Xanthomonas cucurbitae]|uniref:Uncharacterized protein n=1 Tax=Xanthomonas cucurbitae TaxID=56453 RepID=A0ABY7YG49_9XANT|nr:hypothetical protein [Xanthomonas cucurbitae]WDM68916.1 hypothetical protein K6981_06515 [Xanthomonas cucurbitae]WDM72789.1 hypothetical protein K6978_06500 [Xanthomonas cucurbitae]